MTGVQTCALPIYWREIEFLAALRKAFALNDNQMDSAMTTAAQFPAVKLGGDAPD